MFTVSRSTTRLLVFAAFAALVVVACESNLGPPAPPPPGKLQSITVTPNPGGALTGGTIQYIATGRDVTNAIVAISPAPTWSVVNSGGAINIGSGLFTGGATPGTYSNTIRATSGSLSGFATAVLTATIPGPALGRAATYGILAASTVTCAGAPDSIKADVGIFPGTAITGPCVVTGTQHLGDAFADSAQLDLTSAYDALVALPCNTIITPADLAGRTLTPGVYCAASSVAVSTTVTLNGGGDANARFVIQIGSTLTMSTGSNIVLSGGTQAKNVWWQIGTSATLNTGTTFNGNILAYTSITLNDNVKMLGRALARGAGGVGGAVTLGTGSVITLP